ncbi:MAG: ABC transporter permease [Kineosporiaceae bacterium]
MMRQIFLLARRDFLQRARSRSFMVTVLLSVGLVLAIGPLASIWMGQTKPAVIAVTGQRATDLARTLQATAAATDVPITIRTVADVAAGETALRDDEADLLVVDTAELVWNKDANPTALALAQSAVQQLERSTIAAGLGLRAQDAARIVSPPPPAQRTLEAVDPQRTPRVVGASLLVILLYMSIVIFGQFVLLGVMEEKANRVVEVVLSRARPTEVLAGKVLGIGALGLIEVVALSGAGLITVRMIDLPEVRLPSLSLAVAGLAIAWFVLGYAFYAVVYAALGATISRQEDVQGAATLPTILLLLGYFVGLILTSNPGSTLAQVFSLIPFWTPVVMPARIALGVAAWWEVAVAVTLMIGSAIGLIWWAGRIYSGAILRIGKKVGLREAWRAAG